MCSRTEPRIVQRKERLIEDTSPNPMNREKGRCSGDGGFSHSLLVPHRNANQPIKIYWNHILRSGNREISVFIPSPGLIFGCPYPSFLGSGTRECSDPRFWVSPSHQPSVSPMVPYPISVAESVNFPTVISR